MPADAQIRITAENQTPQAFRQVDQSLKSLDQQTRAVQSSTRQSAAALGLLDDEAKQAAVGVTNLGRSVFRTSAEAKKFGGVFSDQNGRLREANGTYAKTNETVGWQFGRCFGRAFDRRSHPRDWAVRDYECPDCGTHRPDQARDDQHRGECVCRSSSIRIAD